MDKTPDIDPSIGLAAKYVRAERRRKWLAFFPVAPLILFLLITFFVPVAYMFYKSVDNEIVSKTLVQTTENLKEWDGESLPTDATYLAILHDLANGAKDKTITRVGQRLNYDASGISSLFRKSARRAAKLDETFFADEKLAREELISIDKRWGDIEVWRVIKKFLPEVVPYYYASAFDARYSAKDDEFYFLPEDQRIYLKLFFRTVLLSLLITFSTLLLGYPTAFLLSTLPSKTANLLMILVLLPFWTSLLVRTTSWIVLLQEEGVINDLLVLSGIVDEENRFRMIHNALGTVIAMTHILLPFMILPLYSVMKSISPVYMRAGRSLGAGPFTAFLRVYFPQTTPGIGAGGILVFILAVGYYITPALVGGTSGVFISNRIAYHISSSLNWGLGAALGLILLLLILALYLIYSRVVGADKLKLG